MLLTNDLIANNLTKQRWLVIILRRHVQRNRLILFAFVRIKIGLANNFVQSIWSGKIQNGGQAKGQANGGILQAYE